MANSYDHDRFSSSGDGKVLADAYLLCRYTWAGYGNLLYGNVSIIIPTYLTTYLPGT